MKPNPGEFWIVEANGKATIGQCTDGEYWEIIGCGWEGRVDRAVRKIDLAALLDETEAVLADALRFYADPERYKGPNHRLEGEPDKYQPADLVYLLDVDRDVGNIARKALQRAGKLEP
jgi:hypothetical protein